MAKTTKAEDADGVDFTGIFSEEELEELSDRFDPCTHGRKLRCDDCSTRDWDQGRKEGFENGFFWVIDEIRKRAGKAFTENKDSMAETLRDLANSVIDLAEREKVLPLKQARKRQ